MCYLNQVEVRFPLFVFESRLAATSRKRPLRGSPTHALLGPWFVNPPLPTTEKDTHFRVPFVRGWRFASRFSSSRAGRQQLRESCRLRRTAEPRAKAPWFGDPPLLSTKSRHHKFGASCKGVEVRFPLFVFESKLAATSRKRPLRGSPNHALLGPWFVKPPLPTTEKRTSL